MRILNNVFYEIFGDNLRAGKWASKKIRQVCVQEYLPSKEIPEHNEMEKHSDFSTRILVFENDKNS